MKNNYNLLVSINFVSTSGGIARVARLMSESLSFNKVFSFYGEEKEINVSYFNKNTFLLYAALLKTIILKKPGIIAFDHVGPASLLKFIPGIFLKNSSVVIFLHDEEAWQKVSARHSWGLSKATHLLCNSNYTYKRFIASNPAYCHKTKVCLLAGVPKDFMVVAGETEKFNSYKGKRYCLFVSRLWKEHRYKGHFELLKAFSLLINSERKFDLNLIIVGRGDDVIPLKDAINKSNLEKNVEVLDDVNDNELAILYQYCTALVFPSTREGFGFVFLEAMYFKKACIGVVDQPAEEIIVNNETGILLKNSHPETIKEILLDICNDEEKYIKFGMKGYELYNSKFLNIHFKKRFLECIGL